MKKSIPFYSLVITGAFMLTACGSSEQTNDTAEIDQVDENRYQSETLGMSFEYPEGDWEITQEYSGGFTLENEAGLIEFTKEQKTSDKTDILEWYEEEPFYAYTSDEAKQIEVGGLPAIRFDDSFVLIMLNDPEHVIQIANGNRSDVKAEDSQKALDDILSSIEFSN